MSIVAGLTIQQLLQQQKTYQKQIKQLEAKIKSSGARNNRAGAKGDGPSRTYLSMVARGVLVDSSTQCYVGIGKMGQPNNDIYEKSWLAKQEGCAPAERCWLPLIARGGCAMCPDPAAHGDAGSAMHTYKQVLIDKVKAKSRANEKARSASGKGSKKKRP